MPGSPRPAALFAAVSLIAFATPGCDFVGERQADTAFPRVVELKNASQDRIDLTALSSTPDAKAPKLQIVEQEEYGEVVVAVPACGG